MTRKRRLFIDIHSPVRKSLLEKYKGHVIGICDKEETLKAINRIFQLNDKNKINK